MNELFRYGNVIFSYPMMNNVDDMVEMMNDEEISSVLFTREKIFTKEMEIDFVNIHQSGNTFSVFDIETFEYIGNCGFNEIEIIKAKLVL